ncbi:testis-expressed protein 15 [Discoglossus pictus]
MAAAASAGPRGVAGPGGGATFGQLWVRRSGSRAKKSRVTFYGGGGCRTGGIRSNPDPDIGAADQHEVTEEVYLARCLEDKREYTDIQNALNEARLNVGCELRSSWQFGETKLIFNHDLENKFAAKRSEMRDEGRHGRELQDHYCFLVLNNMTVMDICRNGLQVDGSFSSALGNPLFGVYLFRHIDVALNFAQQRNAKSNTILIFKALLGKIKQVQPIKSTKKKLALDPTPNYDCHISRKAPSPKESSDEQFINSLVYIYEYDGSSQPVDKPRHCLPYALISVTYLGQKTEILPLIKLKSKSFPSGNDKLGNCTVAKRIGKGKDATVVFESIRKPLVPTPSWTSEIVSGNALPYSQSQDILLPCTSIDHTTLGKVVPPPVFQNMTDSSISSSELCSTNEAHVPIIDSLQSLIKTSMLITSRCIKDPRLLKDNTVLAHSSLLSSDKSESFDKPENLSSPENYVRDNPGKKTSLYLSFEEARLHENQFKSTQQLKINKYSSYLPLYDKDKKTKDESLEKCSSRKKVVSKDHKQYKKHVTNFGNDGDQSYSSGILTNGTCSAPQKPFKTVSSISSTEGSSQKVMQDSKKKCAIESTGQVSTSVCISRRNNQVKDEKQQASPSRIPDKKILSVVTKKSIVATKHLKKLKDVSGKTKTRDIAYNSQKDQGKELNNSDSSQQNDRSHVMQIDVNKKSTETTKTIPEDDKVTQSLHCERSCATNDIQLSKPQKSKDHESLLGKKMVHKVTRDGKCAIKKTLGKYQGNGCKITLHKRKGENTEKSKKIKSSTIQQQGTMTNKQKGINKTKNLVRVSDKKLPSKGKPKVCVTKSINTQYMETNTKENSDEKDEKLFSTKNKDRKEENATIDCKIGESEKIKESETSGYKIEMNCSTPIQEEKLCENQISFSFTPGTEPLNQPCELEDIALQLEHPEEPMERKTTGSNSINMSALPVQDSENKIYTNMDLENTNLENEIVNMLHSRIDWQSLALIGDATSSTPCSENCDQFYSYKPRKQKEPGGMRIFPDMQITIVNTSDSYTDNTVNYAGGAGIYFLQNSQTNLGFAENKENYVFEDQVRQATNNVSMLSEQDAIKKVGETIEENRIEETIEENKDILVDLKSSHEKVSGISRTKKINSKFQQVTTTHKQAQSILKKKMLSNKCTYGLTAKSSGRIKKFSDSEENIKSVLSLLSDEIPLCKNKHISKKLDRAILHLRKAHKRVQKSLQLVAKAGQRRNALLLKRQTASHSSFNVSPSTEKSNNSVAPCEEVVNISKLQEGKDILKMATQDLQFQNPCKKVVDSEVKCLEIEETDVITKQDHSKTIGSSTCLPSVDNKSMSFPDVSVDKLSDYIQSNKENAAPPVSSTDKPVEKDISHQASSPKRSLTPSNIKGSPKPQDSAGQKDVCMLEETTSNTTVHQNLAQKLDLNVKHNRDALAPVKMECDKMAVSLVKQLSKILKTADEACSLKALFECKHICNKMIPAFIKSFEKKQQCSFKDVVVDRKLLVEKNIKVCFRHVLKPQAIDSFIELQMMMETNQFVENRIRYLERKPTYRSLLWYDSSLYTELLGGECGYQQQSPLYTAFQKKLKQNGLTALQNHHNQLCELHDIHEMNGSYYVFLKYRREIEECEAILNLCSDHLDFSLSMPLTCGVHTGDTLEDLEALQKSTLDLIRTYVNHPKCDPGKQEHALCLLEVIAAKINVIKTSESVNSQLALFGMEHLLFDAAKTIVLKQRTKYDGQRRMLGLTKEFLLKVNHYALSKLFEIYGTPNQQTVKVRKEQNKPQVNKDLRKDFGFSQQQVCYVGKIIDQARSAEPLIIKQMILDCRKHLNAVKKYFQILQECDAEHILIKENNVLRAVERQEKITILLKPEAVETYVEVVMTYETLHFLNCLVASQEKQKRFRGLLWFDTSILSDLIHCQEELSSHLEEDMGDALEVIERTISDLMSELEIISDYSDSVNYSYALQIMTRELSELSELKNLVSKSKTTLATYIHFSPYSVSINFGSTPMELEYNYNQFSDFLDILMSAPKKDLGKMAHTMKIMKTIELMKGAVFKSGKLPFDLLVCQILQNKKKRDQELANNGFGLGTKTESRVKDNTAINMYCINKKQADTSPKKRTNNQTITDHGDHTSSLNPKKQKMALSLISSPKKQEENRTVQSNIRMESTDDQNNKTASYQKISQSPVAKDCKSTSKAPKEKHVSPKRENSIHLGQKDVEKKKFNSKQDVVAPADVCIIEHGLVVREGSSVPEMTDAPFTSVSNKESSTVQECVSSEDNGPNPQVQVQDMKDAQPSVELTSSSGSSDKTVGAASEAATPQTEEKSILKKFGFTTEKKSLSVHFADTCPKAKEQKKDNPELPVTEILDQEVKEGKKEEQLPLQNEHHSSTDWNKQHSQALVPMNSPYAQHPGTVYPWHYSLYLWYQNCSNSSVMAQSYQGMAHDSQQTMPYAGSSAFSMQNVYTANQHYPNFSNHMQPQVFPSAGLYNSGLPYNYNIPPPVTHQGSSQTPFPYGPAQAGMWSWGKNKNSQH